MATTSSTVDPVAVPILIIVFPGLSKCVNDLTNAFTKSVTCTKSLTGVPSEVGQSLPLIKSGLASELCKILGIRCVAPSCFIRSHLFYYGFGR